MSRYLLLPLVTLSATSVACQTASDVRDPSSRAVNHAGLLSAGSIEPAADPSGIQTASVEHDTYIDGLTTKTIELDTDSDEWKVRLADKTFDSAAYPYYDYKDPYEEPDDTGAYDVYEPPSLFADSSGTLTEGETVTLIVDAGSSAVYSVRWDLDDSETVDDGYVIQQARWSEPGTYTVSAHLELDDGTSQVVTQTFTVLAFDLDVTFLVCEDGSVGAQLTLTGTHSEGTYGIYGTSDLVTWTPMDIEIFGADGTTIWDNCAVNPRPDTFFFTAAVEDNPDNDEWTTGFELLVSDTDPWTYEDGYNCLLVENDGSWERIRTSAEVCTDFDGALSSGLLVSEVPDTGGTHHRNPSHGVELPDDWARNADENGTDKWHRPYVDDIHDCDDFAAEFEDAMEEDGYEVTFTLVVDFDKATCTRPVSAHALNDFHDSEGRIGFWEPQINRKVDLDLDQDGFVGLSENGGAYGRPTEVGPDGRCISIDTFDDIEDAIEIYGPLD
jgi:hypothetical protein